MFQNMKPHLKWSVPLAVIIILLVLFLLGQNPQIISATVSPEVIVKGQNQEITVTAVVKSGLIVPVKIQVVMTGRGYEGQLKTQKDYLKYYSVFKRNPKSLGYLQQAGKDSQGNRVYVGKFNIQKDAPQTVQIKLTNFGLTLTALRLAISTRSFVLPPDPGEAGKQTLEGIDSDNDDLRDDVQREIMFLAPESEKLRMALGQEAKIAQSLATQSGLTKKESDELLSKESDAGGCVYAVHPTTEQTLHINYALETKLENSVLNIPARKKLKKDNYKIAGIQFTGFPDIKRCSFNPADYLD